MRGASVHVEGSLRPGALSRPRDVVRTGSRSVMKDTTFSSKAYGTRESKSISKDAAGTGWRQREE